MFRSLRQAVLTGLLLLAVDLPVLRPQVNAALIRLRRWWTRRGRR